MSDDARGLVPRIDRICAVPVPIVRADGGEFARRGYAAEGWFARLVGLLGTRALAYDEALWIPRCGRVHTWGMAASISCAFLDADGRVLRVVDPVPPWRVVGQRGARITVEGPAGMCRALRPGDRLGRGRSL